MQSNEIIYLTLMNNGIYIYIKVTKINYTNSPKKEKRKED